MTTKIKKTKPLIDQVTYPAHLVLADKTVLSTYEVARAIADDKHPGDDAVCEQWLMRCAVHCVAWRRLRAAIRRSDGRLQLTPEIARDFIDAYDDDVVIWGGLALDDLVGDNVGGCVNSRLARLHVEEAALVVLLGALIVESRCDLATVPIPTGPSAESDEDFVPTLTGGEPKELWS